MALVLAALWRARRLGPLVAERLPVVVRAAETVEGHARLYQSRRARDRAPPPCAPPAGPGPARLGLARTPGRRRDRAGPGGPVRWRRGTDRGMLFGPVPADDAALVTLADDLDALEREVRTP